MVDGVVKGCNVFWVLSAGSFRWCHFFVWVVARVHFNLFRVVSYI